jgi:hypothetical protein
MMVVEGREVADAGSFLQLNFSCCRMWGLVTLNNLKSSQLDLFPPGVEALRRVSKTMDNVEQAMNAHEHPKVPK